MRHGSMPLMWWPTPAFEPVVCGIFARFGPKVAQSGLQSAQAVQCSTPGCNQAPFPPHLVLCNSEFHFPHTLACMCPPHCECVCPSHKCGQSGTFPLSHLCAPLQMPGPRASTAGGHTWQSECVQKAWMGGGGWPLGLCPLAVLTFGAPMCIVFQLAGTV